MNQDETKDGYQLDTFEQIDKTWDHLSKWSGLCTF